MTSAHRYSAPNFMYFVSAHAYIQVGIFLGYIQLFIQCYILLERAFNVEFFCLNILMSYDKRAQKFCAKPYVLRSAHAYIQVEIFLGYTQLFISSYILLERAFNVEFISINFLVSCDKGAKKFCAKLYILRLSSCIYSGGNIFRLHSVIYLVLYTVRKSFQCRVYQCK